jgi:hypothetical protein
VSRYQKLEHEPGNQVISIVYCNVAKATQHHQSTKTQALGPALRPTTLTSVDFDISRHSESQAVGEREYISNTATMAATRYCPSCLTKASPTTLFRSAPRTVAPAPFLRPFHTSSPLAAVQSANAAKYKRKDQQTTASKKKKKSSTNYATPDLRDAIQFSLVDAMR